MYKFSNFVDNLSDYFFCGIGYFDFEEQRGDPVLSTNDCNSFLIVHYQCIFLVL